MKKIIFALLICASATSCKKDTTREIIMTWDKPCIFNERNTGNMSNNNCISTGKTISKPKGYQFDFTLYNCTKPTKQQSHVVITVKGKEKGLRKGKVIYDSNEIYHQINIQIP
jgi:hypothetical protein